MNKHGITLLESILSIALFGVLAVGFVSWLLAAQDAAVFAGQRTRALFLAEEGLEASRNIRDSAYASLTTGTHGLALSSNLWSFSGSSDTTDGFTRAVFVSAIDTNRKQVTSTVSWDQTTSRTGSVSLVSYLTNWIATSSGKPLPITPDTTLDLGGPANGAEVALYYSGGSTYVLLGRLNSGSSGEFYVIDVSTPSSPSVTATLEIGDNVNSIAVSGSYAYLATGSNSRELQVVDLSTISSPSVVGWLNLSGNDDATSVVAEGNNLYLGRMNSGSAEIVSVSILTPTVPVTVSSYEVGDSVWKLVLAQSNQYLYAATGNNSGEMLVINVSTPTSISLAGTLDISGTNDGTAVNAFSTYAVLGQDDGQFYVVDVSTPSSPTVVSSTFDVGNKINDLAMGVDDDYVFAGSGTVANEVSVIDITTLTAPTSYFSVDLSGNEATGVIWDATLNRTFGSGTGNTEEFFVLIP